MTTPLVTFIVPGSPPIARRVRAGRRRGSKRIQIYQADETVADEQRVADAARRSGVLLPIDVPLRVDVVAVFDRPASRPRSVPAEVWRTGRRVSRPATPDRDNVDKAVLDGMQVRGRFEARGMLANDGQAADGRVRKVWAAKGEEPHTVVTVWLSPWLDEDEGLTGQALAGHAVAKVRGTPMSPNGTLPGGP